MTREDWETLRVRVMTALLCRGTPVNEALRVLEIEVPVSLAPDEVSFNRCPKCGLVVAAVSKLTLHMGECG